MTGRLIFLLEAAHFEQAAEAKATQPVVLDTLNGRHLTFLWDEPLAG